MLCKWEGDNIRKVMACNGVEQVMVPIGGEYLEKSWLERMGASTLWPAQRARLARLLKRQVGKQVHKYYQIFYQILNTILNTILNPILEPNIETQD